jgi:hypothetical protein
MNNFNLRTGRDGPNLDWKKKEKNKRLLYLLIPWCRTLFEKLIVTQLVNKYPPFLWNPKVLYSVHKSPSERPSFAPIQHNWQNYSFVYFNL